jgi:PHD/YefM family antitoxin component YafN of YafNO toxin-antitoxin module
VAHGTKKKHHPQKNIFNFKQRQVICQHKVFAIACLIWYLVSKQVPKGVSNMNTIPAQEIKRRGIAAVDELIANGAVHVIRNNQPQYVILSEARYQALLEAEDDAYTARVLASLEDLRNGRVQRGTAAELLKELSGEG